MEYHVQQKLCMCTWLYLLNLNNFLSPVTCMIAVARSNYLSVCVHTHACTHKCVIKLQHCKRLRISNPDIKKRKCYMYLPLNIVRNSCITEIKNLHQMEDFTVVISNVQIWEVLKIVHTACTVYISITTNCILLI